MTSAYALREIPPFLFSALRMCMLILAVAPFLRIPARDQWGKLLAVGMLVGVIHFGLSLGALKLSGDLSSPAIVLQSYVPMSVLFAWWMLGEKFAWRTATAVIISFAGVLVLGFDPLVIDQPIALVLMLAAAAAIALGSVYMRNLRGIDAFNQQGWMAIISVLPLFLLSAVLEPDGFSSLPDASWVGWSGVAYSAIISSLVGHGIYYLMLQKHPVALVTPYMLLSPLIAVALGVVIWGDRPGLRLWIGGALVLGGVLAIALRRMSKFKAAVGPD